jgi:hypothetical protein
VSERYLRETFAKKRVEGLYMDQLSLAHSFCWESTFFSCEKLSYG